MPPSFLLIWRGRGVGGWGGVAEGNRGMRGKEVEQVIM